MRIITIGDIHGHDSWKPVIEDVLEGKFDKVICTGDYTDSFSISNETMINNLLELIKLKSFYPDKIELLVGNHEMHYMLRQAHVSNPYLCSGYRRDFHFDVYPIFKENFNKFKLAHQIDNYLWTHAGIHQGWYNMHYKDVSLKDIGDKLNEDFENEKPRIFEVGWMRGGVHDVGGPLWADKRMTSKKPLKGLHQIVGHTPVPIVTTVEKSKGTSITYCDCLKSIKSFHLITI